MRRLSKLRSRLWLGSLDERIVPNVYQVQNLQDAGTGSLRQAVSDANAHSGADTITFKADLGGTIFLTTGQINIADALTIDASSNKYIQGISGDSKSRIFTTSIAPASTPIVFKSLWMSDGFVDKQDGAAIYVGDEAVSLFDCTLTSNGVYGDGGAIYVQSSTGSLTVDRCVFIGNIAGYGEPGDGDGGAISMGGAGKLTIQNSTLTGNQASSDGGGIYFFNGGSLLLENSTLSNNHAYGGMGGGLYFFGTVGASGLTVRNCTISGNSSTGDGGGIALYKTNGTLTVQNSTISENEADTFFGNSGGGIARADGNAQINIHSSVISGNTAVTAPDIFSAGTVNAQSSAIGSSAGFVISGSNNLAFGLDLKLGTFGDHGGLTETYRPATNSPLINKGSNPAGLTTDQRGVDRVIGGAIDIGAVEVITSLVVTNANDAGPGSLRQAVANANLDLQPNTITFDPVFFSTAKTITLTSGPMAIEDTVIINGPSAKLVSISGNDVSRIFTLNEGTITLNGLSLIHANDNSGAVIYSPYIVDHHPGVSLTKCIFSNNSSFAGSTIYFGQNSHSNLLVDGCTFTANSTGSRGGAIYLNSVVDATIRNSTFSGNSAGVYGGAIALENFFAKLNIQNSTITKNTASIGAGGGIAWLSGNATVTIDSSIVAGNNNATAPDISSANTIATSLSALGSTKGAVITAMGNLPIGIDLKLGALADNGGPTMTHLPALDSPLLNQGGNSAGLATDQRGMNRVMDLGADIGAVEVDATTITTINRTTAQITTAASVTWQVTFGSSYMAGLTASNFALTGPGAVGASITNVNGNGTTWFVTAATGADGNLELDMVNGAGLLSVVTNLPFNGQSYIVNKVPLAATITASPNAINDGKVGPDALTLTAVFNKPMDPSVVPTFTFPNENPGAALAFSSGTWLDDSTYAAKFNVTDTNLNRPDIDVRINGGKDIYGDLGTNSTAVDLIDIDTQNPYVASFTRDNPTTTNLGTVSWTLQLSESITGLSASNFSLVNGGLTGTVNITNVTGSTTTWHIFASTGTGQGTLGLNLNNSTGVGDFAGNPITPVGIIAPAYAIDHVAASVANVLPSGSIITDDTEGPGEFQLTVSFNEAMDQSVNPTITFPVENPSGTIIFANGLWVDATTYRATYNVFDVNTAVPDLDVKVSGAKDSAGNVQNIGIVPNVFDIDTANPYCDTITRYDVNPNAGPTVHYTVTFTESVVGLTATNFTLTTTGVSGASIVGVTGNADTYTVEVNTGTGTGTVRLNFATPGGLTDVVGNVAVNEPIAGETYDIIALPPAKVQSVIINNGAVQRSRVTSLQVNFDQTVNLPANAASAFTLHRISDGANVTCAANVIDNGTTTVDLTFVGGAVDFGSLMDGKYELQIVSSMVTTSAGGLDGDNNGTAGGDYVLSGDLTNKLFRLFGDADGNGVINSTDFAAFRSAFGLGSSMFDFNNDGQTNSNDFAEFRKRFGLAVN